MTFKVGETVVYPHHGAAQIQAIEKRVIKGEEKTYLVLKVAQGDLTVRVPADNVDLVGVRDVVDSDGLDRVFNVLRQPYTEEPTNWSRRYKANVEKLASGDVIKVAEVVRDLYRRDLDRGLSAGEKRMLAKAKQILVSELALAERTDEDKAATMLDESIPPLKKAPSGTSLVIRSRTASERRASTASAACDMLRNSLFLSRKTAAKSQYRCRRNPVSSDSVKNVAGGNFATPPSMHLSDRT